MKSYFDTIDHLLLKEKWAKVIGKEELPEDQYALFKSLTKYTYIYKNSFLNHFEIDLETASFNNLSDLIPPRKAKFKDKFNVLREKNLLVQNESCEEFLGKKRFYGIPQGSSISALLSNIYLIDFDDKVKKESIKRNFFYRRYCDDLLFVVPSESVFVINEFIKEELGKYHVKIQSKKTELIKFSIDSKNQLRSFDLKKLAAIDNFNDIDETKYYRNLQYLGFEFNGKNIYIRTSSLSRYFRKMKGRIVKSVMMAYSPGGKSDKIFKEQIFHRYTHLGKRNFLKYAYNSSKEYYYNSKREKKDGMHSPSIKKQLARHFQILLTEIKKTSEQRAEQKSKKVKV